MANVTAPAQPSTFDDRNGLLKRWVNGVVTSTTFFLKRRLKIWAHFEWDGFNTWMVVDGVDPSGPAANLMDNTFTVVASMDPGDKIVSFEGMPIHSWTDYINQMNQQIHPFTSNIQIMDVSSGTVNTFIITPAT